MQHINLCLRKASKKKVSRLELFWTEAFEWENLWRLWFDITSAVRMYVFTKNLHEEINKWKQVITDVEQGSMKNEEQNGKIWWTEWMKLWNFLEIKEWAKLGACDATRTLGFSAVWFAGDTWKKNYTSHRS